MKHPFSTLDALNVQLQFACTSNEREGWSMLAGDRGPPTDTTKRNQIQKEEIR